MVAEFIGKPLATDSMTANRLRLDYARILVEVDQNASHPVEIPITLPDGSSIKQSVLYEWRLIKCGACGLVGHETGQCRRTRMKVQPEKTVQHDELKNSSKGDGGEMLKHPEVPIPLDGQNSGTQGGIMGSNTVVHHSSLSTNSDLGYEGKHEFGPDF